MKQDASKRAHSELDHQGTKSRWTGSSTTGHIEGEQYGSTPGLWPAIKRLDLPTVQQETISNSYNDLLTDVENM
jgi:hypothetical protein